MHESYTRILPSLNQTKKNAHMKGISVFCKDPDQSAMKEENFKEEGSLSCVALREEKTANAFFLFKHVVFSSSIAGRKVSRGARRIIQSRIFNQNIPCVVCGQRACSSCRDSV